MHRIALTLALVLLACSAPALSLEPRAPAPCRAEHGARFCRALELRHAAETLRLRELELLNVAGDQAPHRRALSWRIGRLYRQVVWLRRSRIPGLWNRAAAATDEHLAIRIAARRYGLDPDGMARVGGCESTGDSSGQHLFRLATNGWFLGLFQLGPTVRASSLRGDWRNALENALAAARTVVADGCWCQWSCGWAYYA
jgi:hypothetical protein